VATIAGNPIEFVTLARNPYSLALAAQFLARHPPFSRFEFGKMMLTLFHQIEMELHLVGAANDRIVAYLGWMRTSEAVAEAWVAGEVLLSPDEGGRANAVTVFATDDSSLILPMIREAKRRNPGRPTYWKRHGSGGEIVASRAVRLRSQP
jgi:hypothetical protein